MTNEQLDVVTKALRRAWSLGQTYWSQADSESYSQNRRADETQLAFQRLVEDTRAALASDHALACTASNDSMAVSAAPQAEPKREPLSDEQVTKGEYVLATKFGDGDPGDHWGVGFYDRFANGRHYVVDSAGKQIRGNGFRRVGRITVDVGRWFLSAGRSLEASPPGTVNLWTMLTERAHRIGGTDPALDDLQAKERA